MPTVILRTFILYILVIIAMKLMGKRQIGQMQLSELVTVTMLSELASYAIQDLNVPIMYSIVPVIILTTIEITVSFLCIKSRFVSRIMDGKPSYLIYRGELNQKELASSRLTLTEVISEIRIAGYSSVSDINYMILEPDGKISVIPKTSRDLQPGGNEKSCSDKGIDHALIIDGELIPSALEKYGKGLGSIDKYLKSKKIKNVSDVFYLAVNDTGDTTLIMKEK